MTSQNIPSAYSLRPVFLSRCHWLYRVTALLLGANFLLQLFVMLGWIPAASDMQTAVALSLVEMLLMFVVLALAAFIVLWCRREPQAQALVPVAWLNLIGLLFCTLGDGVNKNFAEQYFSYDQVIRHSYLIDSIFCFFPGYGLMIIAMILAVRGRVAPRHWILPLGLAMVLGGLAFHDLWRAEMDPQASVMMLAYSCLISAVGLMAWPLLRAYSWRQLGWVALGAVLATLADALIGRFWIADDSYYPMIRYVNWVVYFSSQLMLLQLPLRAAQAAARS